MTKRELIRQESRKRKALYGAFISEFSRLVIDALVHGIEKPETMRSGYALLNRIRLSASDYQCPKQRLLEIQQIQIELHEDLSERKEELR